MRPLSSPGIVHSLILLFYILCLVNVSSQASLSSASSTNSSAGVAATSTNVTHTPSSTSSSSVSSTASSTSSPSATPIVLDTQLDPAFGVLGGILIITGLPSTFLGHKNRWSSFFIIGFYTLSLVCLVLILQYGVLRAINPPDEVLRGLFVLACGVAGFVGGGIAIFFWYQAKYFIGAWGGFALALWIQCFKDGGLIGPVGFRWIFYIALMAVGFIICTIPKIHYHVLLVATAIVGSSAFMLGVDCFTAANLKEFYIWNLGFTSLFPKYQKNGIAFPVSQVMEIELGLIGAVALIGAAVQRQVLRVLQRKLQEIQAEQRRRDNELESQAGATLNHLTNDLEEWEKQHGRKNSQFSTTPLMKDQEVNSPGTEDTLRMTPTGERPRYGSNLSSFFAPAEDKRQSIGPLPAMDLGIGLESDIPGGLVSPNNNDQAEQMARMALTADEIEDLKKKEELMNEINSIRKSIEALRAETPVSGAASDYMNSGSRHQSFTSRRTLSQNLFAPAPRPPRSDDPRTRIVSMDLLHGKSYASAAPVTGVGAAGSSISRPNSAPLLHDDWDTYIRERRLYQPPSGVTNPIMTSPPPEAMSPFIPVSPALSEALMLRQRRESAMLQGQVAPVSSPRRNSSPRIQNSSSSDDIPLARVRSPAHQKVASSGSNSPVVILPPRKAGKQSPSTPDSPSGPRVKTFEELTQRHREKMRDLQAPLSQAEQEHAQLVAAKDRWERSKAAEKHNMARRDADKVAGATTTPRGDKRQSAEPGDRRDGSQSRDPRQPHSRSLSADKLARVPAMPSSSRRQSTMKVEDWQNYQQEMDNSSKKQNRQSRRESKSPVPFPVAREDARPSGERRRSSRFMNTSGDAVN